MERVSPPDSSSSDSSGSFVNRVPVRSLYPDMMMLANRLSINDPNTSTPGTGDGKPEIKVIMPPRRFRRPPNWYQAEDFRLGHSFNRKEILFVSNLDESLKSKTIKRMFLEYGKVKSIRIYYDERGCSTGAADITFTKRQDALAALRAIKKNLVYNRGGKLRGKMVLRS